MKYNSINTSKETSRFKQMSLIPGSIAMLNMARVKRDNNVRHILCF